MPIKKQINQWSNFKKLYILIPKQRNKKSNQIIKSYKQNRRKLKKQINHKNNKLESQKTKQHFIRMLQKGKDLSNKIMNQDQTDNKIFESKKDETDNIYKISKHQFFKYQLNSNQNILQKLSNCPIIIITKMSSLTIENVVSFAKLSNKEVLDQKFIASKISGSRYNPKRFPAVIIRHTKPKGTVLIFKSGKIIILGSVSENEAELTARKTVRDLKKVTNKPLQLSEFRVTNMVARAELGWSIDLGWLVDDCFGIKDDNFPGLIYRMGDPVKTILIFHSGKIVLTGAHDRLSIEKGFVILKEKLEKYRIAKIQSLQ